jgi:ketosteroid isomerase-like protein
MSQENVEVVRKLYELFARRDLERAFPDYANPNLELRVPPLYPDTPPERGSFRRLATKWQRATSRSVAIGRRAGRRGAPPR